MTDLLLVEDDPAIVTALSDFLKREGFAVTAASGQMEALRLLEGPPVPPGPAGCDVARWQRLCPLRRHQGPISHARDVPHRPGR